MANMEGLKKLVDSELDKIAGMPQLSDAAVCTLDKLIDIRKDINEVEMDEMNGGYSQKGYGLYYDDGMRYYNGNSYRMPMRREYYDGGRSYNDGRMYDGGYSGVERMRDHLRMAMDAAQDETDREMIRKVMSKLNM